MIKVNISEIINTKNAILHKFGLEVYSIVKPYLESNKEVCISFKGLKNITSGFCNASVGKLFLEFKNAKELLSFEGIESNTLWNEKVQSAILLANNPKEIEIRNNAISELLTS